MSARGLRCRGCSKSYGKTRALIDVTLHVSPGEVVGLVGPNGAGKTTLLHSIVGLCKLDAGDVTIDGLPASWPEAKRQMAFMPDDLPRPRHLTARCSSSAAGCTVSRSTQRWSMSLRKAWTLAVAWIRRSGATPTEWPAK
jgi:ABC-type multidrug transport system ATPase subunit